MTNVLETLNKWSKDSSEAAQLVIDMYGVPDEVSGSTMTWHKPGEWKRIIAYKDTDKHNFPAPHIDCVESFIDYQVSIDKVTDLIIFDGSVVVNRTRGEMSARCHDIEANRLALNLAHDIINSVKTIAEARNYYAKEFIGYRKKEPTPYMDKLQFKPVKLGGDPDKRVLTDIQLEAAVRLGKSKENI